jgi:hypothetical protein
VVCRLRWFFRLLRHRSFHLVPCIPPFLGAFIFSMIGRVSSSLSLQIFP